MRSTISLAVATIALLVAAAGCIGGDDPVDDAIEEAATPESQDLTNETFPDARASGDDGEQTSPSSPTLATYENLKSPLNTTLEHQGSFATQDSCVGGGCLRGLVMGDQTYLERIDVTDEIPAHVPVLINVTVTYEPDVSGGFSIFFETEEATLYSYDSSSSADEGGWQAQANALVVRAEQGSVNVVVESSWAEPPEQDYEAELHITADPTTVPAKVPVEVPVDPATPPLIGIEEQASDGTLRLWDASDQSLPPVTGLDGGETVPLEDVEQTGSYVIGAKGNAAAFQVATTPEDAQLRALPLTMALSDPVQPGDDGHAVWETDLDRAPWSVGVYARGEAPVWTYQGAEVEFASPEGVVVSEDSWHGSCLLCAEDVHHTWFSQPLDERIVPGEWTGEAWFEASQNVDVGHILVDYQRP